MTGLTEDTLVDRSRAQVTFFKALPLTPDEAAAQGYERLHVALGDPTLNFSTFAKRRSLVLQRAVVADVMPAGIETVATINVPETSARFTTHVQVFAFHAAIEAQPFSDRALIARGYAPLEETDQHGLLFGGSIGILYEDGRKIRGARSYSVVRGRHVVTLMSDFPIDDSPAGLVESGVMISNLVFDDGQPASFRDNDIAEVAIPVAPNPFHVAYPANWSITGNGFVNSEPSDTVLFSLGDRKSPNGFMTFGYRQDTTVLNETVFDAWATRVAGIYVSQNPSLLGTPAIAKKGSFSALAKSWVGRFYNFHLDNFKFHRQNQIRVVLLARGEQRWTLSLLTDVSKFEEFSHFLVYALGITAFDMMVDSTVTALTSHGLEGSDESSPQR